MHTTNGSAPYIVIDIEDNRPGVPRDGMLYANVALQNFRV